jgi:hypothetical protein
MVKLFEDLPRVAVDAHLHLTRLPLQAFETVAGREGLVDGYSARVKELVGSVVNDEELLTSARLTRAKLAQLDRAAEKETQAEAKAREAREREAELERQKAQAKAQVEREFAQREQASERVEKAQKKAVAKRQTAAERKRLAAEAAALAEKERAVDTKAEAIALDRAVETTKARRQRAR